MGARPPGPDPVHAPDRRLGYTTARVGHDGGVTPPERSGLGRHDGPAGGAHKERVVTGEESKRPTRNALTTRIRGGRGIARGSARNGTSRTARGPSRRRLGSDGANRLGCEANETGARGKGWTVGAISGNSLQWVRCRTTPGGWSSLWRGRVTDSGWGNRMSPGPRSAARWEPGSARRAHGATGRRDTRNGSTRTKRDRSASAGPGRPGRSGTGCPRKKATR